MRKGERKGGRGDEGKGQAYLLSDARAVGGTKGGL